MKKRKLILCITAAALAVIYGILLAVTNKTNIKTIELKETPDEISITLGERNIHLTNENDIWYFTDTNDEAGNSAPLRADENAAETFVDLVSSITTYGTVSRSDRPADIERYGLDDAQTIFIKAYKDEKEIRSLTIGKNSASMTQNYIRLDNSTETLLAGGSMRNLVTSDMDNLKIEEAQEN